MIHAPFTKPVKRGRPLTTGRFNTRAELEQYIVERYCRGWSSPTDWPLAPAPLGEPLPDDNRQEFGRKTYLN